jgi:integrase
MPLTAVFIKNAQSRDKAYKLSDEKGLYLLVNPNGKKYWRLKYRFSGKEQTLAIGIYPQVSLKEARERTLEAKLELQKGIQPASQKKQKQQNKTPTNNSFKVTTERWHKLNIPRWSDRYALKVMQLLDKRAFPFIGNRDITEITNSDVLEVLRKMEDDNVNETTRKVKNYIEKIFTFAIAEGKLNSNPAAGIQGALKALPPTKHQRHLAMEDIPSFIKAIQNDQGHPIVKLGLQLLLLTMTRTGEVRLAKWEEIDFDKAMWHIPASRMKMKRDHCIPLSRQAVQVLQELHQFTGHSEYLARSPNSNKPLSENAFLVLIKRIGFKSKTTTHGLRATASTYLNEQGVRPDVIEKQLAHEERNQVRKAYNHAEYLEERAGMLQAWADHLVLFNEPLKSSNEDQKNNINNNLTKTSRKA